jgi:signal transduction histidine kinase
LLSRFVLENFPEPILVFNAAGAVVERNRAARALRDPEILNLLRPGVADETTLGFGEELRSRGRATRELARRASAGSGNPVLVEGFAVESSFVVRLRDASQERVIRELKEEVCQLRQTESLGLMAATVIHDLNNLLTPMLCFSSALASEVEDGSPAAPLVADIESLAMRAAGLIRDVLSFARPKSLGVEALDLSEVVSAMRPLIQRVFGGTVEFAFDLAEALGKARMERARLEHALLNLLANARHAMPHGGRITVTTAEIVQRNGGAPSAYVALSVTDTGVGMSEEVGAHAFDDFFTTRDGAGGTGLGLASVKRFVTESGGFVRLDSELGRGTTVSIFLPRIAP